MSPLTWIFILPLLAAAVILLIPRNFQFAIFGVAWTGTLASLITAIWIFAHFQRGVVGYQFEQQHAWASSLGISYHVGVDGLNVGLILMGAAVAFAAVCVSESIKNRAKEFYLLILVMAGGIMIGVWGHGDRKNYATFQITLYLSVGALLALLGLIGVYLQLPAGQRTFDIPQIIDFFHSHRMSATAQHFIFPLLLFGFGILVSLWPFHTWAPLGYGSAPPGTAMLHAGVLKKFGLYGLIRVALPIMPDEAQHWAVALMTLSLGNIIYCGFVAMRQRNLNMLLGNSSVAHVGFAFLGIASLSLIGITGAAMIMVAHGFLAALSFAISGYLREQTGTLDMDKMGGLLRRLPFIGTVAIMAMFAGCGVPGFAGFPGEILTLFGTWSRSQVMTGIAVWGALVISGVYMTRAIRDIFHGERAWPNVADASVWRKIPYVLLLVGLLFFGCFPRMLTDSIQASVEPIVGMAAGELHAAKGGAR
jgi:NADH-quinone oxidoreductase subunit M